MLGKGEAYIGLLVAGENIIEADIVLVIGTSVDCGSLCGRLAVRLTEEEGAGMLDELTTEVYMLREEETGTLDELTTELCSLNEETLDKLNTELYTLSEGALDELGTEPYTLGDGETLLKLSIELCTLENGGVGVM